MSHHNKPWRVARFATVAIMLAGLSACTMTGSINGRMNGKPVTMHYQQRFLAQSGTLSTTLPSGEHYTGKVVVGSTTDSGLTFGGKSNDIGVYSGGGNTSNAAAVLMGDKGGSMHCVFTLEQPDSGIAGGGVGQCKLDNGDVINSSF
ncbi:hypothetical protein [Gallaecimonas sp. GXIMD1310]|uniref:hypothetical protein n=1 Tax=Gallaecimonas sp. GXIMD1310 TaxID=3131926 RepID=UPI003250307D